MGRGILCPFALYKSYKAFILIIEQIAPEIIKGGYVAEEFLTFYTTVSDEDKNFILSLAEIKK